MMMMMQMKQNSVNCNEDVKQNHIPVHWVHLKQKNSKLIVYVSGSQGIQSFSGTLPQRFTKRFPVITSNYL